MNAKPKQSGVALLVVLLVVALVAIIATEMASRLQINIQRVINIKENNQAYWYAMGAEQYAKIGLKNLIDNEEEKITLKQPWAQEFKYPVPGGEITAQLEDMHSCFNLNALPGDESTLSGDVNQTDEMDAFENLLLSLELNIDDYTAESVRDAIADYIDEDTQMRNYGAEDSDYESLPIPYIAANQLMTVQSELRLVKGVNPQWFEKLLPLVCVLPNSTELSINVNTLDSEDGPLLAGLTGLSIDDAIGVINSRPSAGWSEVADFLAESTVQSANLNENQESWFDVTTEHFILHTKTSYNSAKFVMNSTFEASSKDGVTILRREFGVID